MNKKIKFLLTMELEIDGQIKNDILMDKIIDSLNDSMPSVLFDNTELDCVVFVNNFAYSIKK